MDLQNEYDNIEKEKIELFKNIKNKDDEIKKRRKFKRFIKK